MKNNRSKTTVSVTILILMMLLGTFVAVINIPLGSGQIVLEMRGPWFDSYMGVNSPAKTVWEPRPNLFRDDPDYQDVRSAWPDAVITFIRPDGTILEARQGPFDLVYPPPQTPTDIQIEEEWTPDAQGKWTVNFYWPGDSKYAEINDTATKYVGGHYDKRDVWCYLSLKPYPTIGLGQTLLINAWITPPPTNQHLVFEGLMFYITDPTGSTLTVGPLDTEAAGTVWFDLPIDVVGTWSVKFDFPGDYISLPATVTREFTCVEDPVPLGHPEPPLPMQEWSFPINTMNREWRLIAGPWYQQWYNATTCASNIYTQGMRTAHVLWKLDAYDSLGGMVGVESVGTGAANVVYGAEGQGIFGPSTPSINTVMNGRGYYNAGGMIHCIDMRTGEEIWAVDGSFDVGAVRNRDPALYDFGSTFRVYDGMSGNLEVEVPGLSIDKFDDPFAYSSPGDRLIKWDVGGSTSNFENRIVWNITNPLPNTSTSHSMIVDGLWIARHFQTGSVLGNTIQVDWITAVDLETGTLKYNTTVIDRTNVDTWIYRQGPAISAANGLVFFAAIPHETEGGGYYAFDVQTGQREWVSEKTDYPWANFWAYTPQTSSPGRLYGLSYNGVYAFNVTDGQILWHYKDIDEYNETPYGSNIDEETGEFYASYAFGSRGAVFGGRPGSGNEVLYAANTEHSPTLYYRGEGLCAIDAINGELLWKIKGHYRPRAAVYGGIVAADETNGFTYFFCKGSTETTVEVVGDAVVQEGDTVLLRGTVLDMSPAQEGTAAMSDASMTAWMEYLHMQQPFPLDAQGVDVTIDAFDPNGNWVHLGDATTDATGQWSLLWETPMVPGKYTIIANFMGSESYYSSSAETFMGLTGTPAATPPPEPTPPPQTETYLLGIGIAVIVAMVVIGLLILLMLRKR